MLESLTSEELQFIKAIEKYKSAHNKHFLSWTEVLRIVRDLGYRRSLRQEAPLRTAPQEVTQQSS